MLTGEKIHFRFRPMKTRTLNFIFLFFLFLYCSGQLLILSKFVILLFILTMSTQIPDKVRFLPLSLLLEPLQVWKRKSIDEMLETNAQVALVCMCVRARMCSCNPINGEVTFVFISKIIFLANNMNLQNKM